MNAVAIPRTNAFFGRGTGSILLDRVNCRGNETRLVNCSSFPPDIFDSHFEDAGVQCFVSGTLLKLLHTTLSAHSLR